MNDFDTPWASEIGDFEIYSKSEHNATAYAESARIRDRIIKCINACAGMQDPAAEIQAMRAAIREAEKSLKYVHDCLNLWHNAAGYNCQSHDADALADAEITLAKLQPFLKP